MPIRRVWIPVDAWVPPRLPQFPGEPTQPLPPEGEGPDEPEGPWIPGYPGQPLPRPPRPTDPGWGVDEGGRPDTGFPIAPGQPLPRPPGSRGPYPVVPEGDIGGHPPLPDLNMPGRWVRILSIGAPSAYPAYVTIGEPPQVEEGYEPRPPSRGKPGTWVVILYQGEREWAWVPDPENGQPDQGLPPVVPEREPKGL